MKSTEGQTEMGKNPQKIEGVIKGLERALAALAPHPDRFFSTSFRSVAASSASVAIDFNQAVARQRMDAYLRDLPERLGLERRINAAKRMLNNCPLIQSRIIPEAVPA
jgi:hypothetical protein